MEKDKANTQLWGRLANAQHGGKLCTLKMVAVYSGRTIKYILLLHMQVPFSVTQGRYLLAQVLAYIQSLTSVP